MGNNYTKEEKLEFEQYKALIDRALYEKDRYIVYRQIRKTLNKDMLDKKR